MVVFGFHCDNRYRESDATCQCKNKCDAAIRPRTKPTTDKITPFPVVINGIKKNCARGPIINAVRGDAICSALSNEDGENILGTTTKQKGDNEEETDTSVEKTTHPSNPHLQHSDDQSVENNNQKNRI